MRKFLRVLFEWLKYGLAIALVAGVVWWLLGDKIKAIFAVRDVDLGTAIAVRSDDADLAQAIRGKLRLSLRWRLYVKYLPAAELTPDKPAIEIAGSFKRKPNEKKNDLPEATHAFSPGSVEMQLRIRRIGEEVTIHRQKIRRDVEPIILQDSGGLVNESQIQDKFKKLEVELSGLQLGRELDLAALYAMAKRPDLAKDYVPLIAQAVGDSDQTIAAAASDILCDLPRGARPPALPTLRRLSDHNLAEVRERAHKALNCCEDRK